MRITTTIFKKSPGRNGITQSPIAAATPVPLTTQNHAVPIAYRTTVPITVSLKKPLAGQTLYRRLYNPATIQPTEKAELIGVSKIFENVTADFCDELPSGAVAVYTTRKD